MSTQDLAKLIDLPVQEVVLDAVAGLKVIQHAREHLPTSVTGQLLGLDIGGMVEVTDCFPLPLRPTGSESSDYELDMLTRLREVNTDHNTVGWYLTSFNGFHINQFLVDTQAQYQSDISNAIVLVYDPLATQQGSLSLRAFRLSNRFLRLHREKRLTAQVLSEEAFTSKDVFEEIPVRLRQSALQKALVLWLADHDDLFDQFEAFDLTNGDFVKKNLEALLYCMSELNREQNAYQAWQKSVARAEQQIKQFIEKRKGENIVRKHKGEPLLTEDPKEIELENPSLVRKPAEPSRLESLLLTYRASQHADQVSGVAGRSLTTQYATKTFGQ
jgi:translation initiation factor 3 subunit H